LSFKTELKTSTCDGRGIDSFLPLRQQAKKAQNSDRNLNCYHTIYRYHESGPQRAGTVRSRNTTLLLLSFLSPYFMLNSLFS
jgi:hypothetical protein